MAYKFQSIPRSSPETPSQEEARLDRENWERIERLREQDRVLAERLAETFRQALSQPLHR
jgi:hypothetical protein